MGQLQARGADIPVFVEIVDRYISFWKTAQALQKDIDDRGVMISEMNSVGAEVMKPNPSIKEHEQTNAVDSKKFRSGSKQDCQPGERRAVMRCGKIDIKEFAAGNIRLHARSPTRYTFILHLSASVV